jgi:autotransporter-associated beta strand protein
MKTQFYRNTLTIFCCLFLGAIGNLHAITKGSWVTTSGGFWDTTTNWVTNPAGSFPNGPGDIALITLPDDGSTIDSNTNITVGSLLVNLGTSGSTSETLNITFSTTNLTFDGNGKEATLINGAILEINTPVILNSDLEINNPSASNSEMVINGSISGNHGITFSGNARVTFNNTNSYTGDTTVLNGELDLDAFTGPTIPGNLTVNGTVECVRDDQFNDTSIVNVFLGSQNNGFFSLLITNQSFSSLIVGDDGQVDSTSPSILTLLSNAPNCLSLSDNCLVQLSEILLLNGGGINYNNELALSHPSGGQGIIGFSVSPGPTSTIDLGGNLAVPLQIAGNSDNPYDLQILNTLFVNGTLNILGQGKVLFSGNLGTFPPDIGSVPGVAVFNEVIVIAGLTGSDVMGTTGTVQLNNFSTLEGLGTIGTSGLAKINNSALCFPGLVGDTIFDSTIGTLTISGSYTQNADAVLFIEANNPSVNSELVIQGGNVSLDGLLLFFANPTGSYSVGDQFVIIDSTAGGTISGTFAGVSASLPPGLSANVIYNSQQVIVELVELICPPCPVTPLLPPSKLMAKLIKNEFLNETEKFVRLTWFPSPTPNLKEYKVYQNDVLIGRVKATLKFNDHHKFKNVTEKYSVTAISTSGIETAPAITFFTPPRRC